MTATEPLWDEEDAHASFIADGRFATFIDEDGHPPHGSSEACGVCDLFGPLTDETRSAMRAEAGTVVRKLGDRTYTCAVPGTRRLHPALTVLSSDRWMTSDEIAQAGGVSADVIRMAVSTAKRRGVAIESKRGSGYRLGRSA